MSQPAVLALEDGTIFRGLSIGASGTTVGEVVFNTAMTGYQEILTDPSYCRQIVTLTYPHIGNTGVTKEDEESTGIQAAGLIIRDLPLLASNFRSEQSLSDYLAGGNTVAIADIDTRKLTRILRDGGAQSGCIMAGAEVDETQALEQARAFAGLKGMDLAKVVTTSEPYEWTEGAWQLPATAPDASDRRAPALSVVALDFGVKRNILRILVDLGCTVTVMPAQSTIDEVMAHAPDGVFFSNGPGDPEPCEYAITLAREVMDRKVPLFGICLGHQILALASGARTEKMKFGHHGANHPVQNLSDKTVMVTSQNHGFTVSEQDLPDTLEVTHRSLFDGTLQGIARKDVPAYSFQGHPEASPGPHDAANLFQPFIAAMERTKMSGEC
ncbi:MAG: carbamoyl-phosphate synthase small subunit [Halieaceae bacterium]|nr:carbamoyl-phosphate synthase small subunit [Halieaceae bacterium]MDG1931949.1 glutamine-hydrolyzing carbamoyl-phosphate synthase small subunit [Luminiphilus sp.]RZO81660.1 MAG: carbamoyl-phosphate synthase small subunit [Halieaceae bacterium]